MVFCLFVLPVTEATTRLTDTQGMLLLGNNCVFIYVVNEHSKTEGDANVAPGVKLTFLPLAHFHTRAAGGSACQQEGRARKAAGSLLCSRYLLPRHGNHTLHLLPLLFR